MTVPQAAIDAAMDTIERLGAGGSRTTVRIVLEAAAPHIAAAERDRIRQLATHVDATYLSLEDGYTPLQFADLLTEGTTT
jgi:hypothetical protein